MRIWAVALNTFKETIRNRVLINILIFAIGLILLTLIIGDWSIYQQAKVIKDFGLSAMSIFGLLIAIFIGIRLMVQELEQKTIYVIASKPINRWEIILGKVLGLSITLMINIVFMSIALWGTELIQEGQIDLGLAPAILLITVEILLIVCFAIFFSSFISSTLSAIFTIVVFTIGHLSGFLRDYIEIYPDKGFHWLLKGIYYIVPNLEILNLKMAVVEHLEQPPHAVLFGLLYGMGYILLLLLLTIIIFSKRDLK
ncbi:ABC transporter permease subunit [bacterium]|nr:ABC transporter permease subunit [bacterium]